METPVISDEVLARYAGDAALEVEGVSGLARDAAEISGAEGAVEIDVHVELAWGAAADGVARQVQERVAEYIERMANVRVGSIDVVVERVGAPPAKR
ncbi:MAG: Asp23/Gls24 family envelope stress response protein [Gaiellaceae bacterium]